MRNKSKDEVTFDEVRCNVCDTLMEWTDEFREWVCPECGNRAFQTEDCAADEIYYEHGPDDDYEEVYDDEYYDPEDMSPDKDGF